VGRLFKVITPGPGSGGLRTGFQGGATRKNVQARLPEASTPGVVGGRRIPRRGGAGGSFDVGKGGGGGNTLGGKSGPPKLLQGKKNPPGGSPLKPSRGLWPASLRPGGARLMSGPGVFPDFPFGKRGAPAQGAQAKPLLTRVVRMVGRRRFCPSVRGGGKCRGDGRGSRLCPFEGPARPGLSWAAKGTGGGGGGTPEFFHATCRGPGAS